MKAQSMDPELSRTNMMLAGAAWSWVSMGTSEISRHNHAGSVVVVVELVLDVLDVVVLLVREVVGTVVVVVVGTLV